MRNSAELLEKLEKRCRIELEQWPDHAVLHDVKNLFSLCKAIPLINDFQF